MNYEFASELYYKTDSFRESLRPDDLQIVSLLTKNFNQVKPGTIKRTFTTKNFIEYSASLNFDEDSEIVFTFEKVVDEKLKFFDHIKLFIDGAFYDINSPRKVTNKETGQQFIECQMQYFDKDALDYIKTCSTDKGLYDWSYFLKRGIGCDRLINFTFPVDKLIKDKDFSAMSYMISSIHNDKLFEDCIAQSIEVKSEEVNQRPLTEYESMLKKAFEDSQKKYQPNSDPNIKTSFEDVSNLRKVL